MPNDSRVVPRSPRECSAIADLLFDITDDRALWTLGDGEDIPDVQCSFLAAVDE